MRIQTGTIPLLALLLAGCSGATSSSTVTQPQVPSLHYTAPVGLSDSDYALELVDGQDSGALTFKLVSPAGGQSRGVAFALAADPAKVVWSSAGGQDPLLAEGSVFTLGAAPKLLSAKASGGELRAGLFQKGAQAPAALNRSDLLHLALSLQGGAPAGPVDLWVASDLQARSLGASGALESIAIRVGTLEVR
jgi:hypothetical protein